MNPASHDLSPALLRVAEDKRFFASLYNIWGGGTLNLDALAKELRAPVAAIVEAGLCFRPRSGADFNGDVKRIAEFAGIEPMALLSFIRMAETLAAFRQSGEPQGFLAAARDARPDGDDDE